MKPGVLHRIMSVPKFIWYSHKRRINVLETLEALVTLLSSEQIVFVRRLG